MKVKVLKNFSCNGVRKKVDQFLSEEDKEKIGEAFGQNLLKSEFIQVLEEPKPVKKKVSKKVDKEA